MLYYIKRGLFVLLTIAALTTVTAAFTARPMEPHPYFANGDFQVIAHRGGKGLAPENTLAAFRRATALGVDVLEMDLRQSADGVPIVLHDRRVDRTTDGRGRVDSLSLAEIKHLDAGYRFSLDSTSFPQRGSGIAVPTLDEVFTAFPDMRFLIEIKDNSSVLATALCQTIKHHRLTDQVIVASFRDGPLQAFQHTCPKVATSAPSGAVLPFVLLHWLRLGAAYHPEHHALQLPPRLGAIQLIDRRLVERAHAHNTQVHAWTINDPDEMQRLIDLGSDGIITDYPDRLLKILQRQILKERR